MDPRRCAQDVLLCDSCETIPLQNHCEFCNINLCDNCVAKHLSDSPKRHNVVPYLLRKSIPNNPKYKMHSKKHCELCSEICDIPLGGTGISDQHKDHDTSNVLQKFSSKTKYLQGDFEKSQITIVSSRHDERTHATFDQTMKAKLETVYKKLAVAATQLGDYTMKTSEIASSYPVKPMLDEPRLIATIDTKYNIYSIICLSDEDVWTCGINEIMKLHNLHGKLLKSIQTKSENMPGDISVTRDGHLVYTDTGSRTVDIVTNKQIQTIIRLKGWRPRNLCSTSSDDLLVTMYSDDYTQFKVVRFSGSKQTHTIQFDDQGRPLYFAGRHSNNTNISENRNMDICVADSDARELVVVNQSGKLRFRYTGHPSNTKQSFTPVGITTDSQSHILTADCFNHRIHVLDQYGQFLRYIQNCDLHAPWGLCLDTSDNLLIAEHWTGKVKKIQYLLTLS
ncbi:uncharacterized protein LOC130047003 [Ostrea edulis]|uniref:uncharacterized protein LOC130047003 n=1 Tax=Ostrea edulis TaxID=37623 RepID=UPI0024AF5492|nr:uncharacterized protein LOC130047003 [Ostrea edulis]